MAPRPSETPHILGAPANNSMEPPPLRFAKHPERPRILDRPGRPGVCSCDASFGLAGRLISRPLDGGANAE